MLKKSNYAKMLFNKSIVINKLHCRNILGIFGKIINGKDIASKNLKNNFDTNKKTIIHGDLTLENILVSKNNLFFIDPLGSFMDIKFDGNFLLKTSPLFDLGKLSQSIISKYEDWKNENDLKKYVYKNEFILKACSETDKVFFNILVDKFKGITKNLPQIVIMHMIIILCRIIRYRVEKHETSAVLCYLYATYFANLIYKNSNFKI